MNLQIGQDGMFTLNMHPQEKFYQMPAYNAFVNRQNNANFDNDVKTAKQVGKVMANPAASLKSEDKQDRYLAAAVLIARYRTPANPTGRPMKQEPIDAAESKLILKGLSDGNWNDNRYNASIPNPFELFNQLGVNQKDGSTPASARSKTSPRQCRNGWVRIKTSSALPSWWWIPTPSRASFSRA